MSATKSIHANRRLKIADDMVKVFICVPKAIFFALCLRCQLDVFAGEVLYCAFISGLFLLASSTFQYDLFRWFQEDICVVIGELIISKKVLTKQIPAEL